MTTCPRCKRVEIPVPIKVVSHMSQIQSQNDAVLCKSKQNIIENCNISTFSQWWHQDPQQRHRKKEVFGNQLIAWKPDFGKKANKWLTLWQWWWWG